VFIRKKKPVKSIGKTALMLCDYRWKGIGKRAILHIMGWWRLLVFFGLILLKYTNLMLRGGTSYRRTVSVIS
tara:strand:- start:8796 stop:9011 length:216 start_codon:yes stop_codon:yes gene_type:complete